MCVGVLGCLVAMNNGSAGVLGVCVYHTRAYTPTALSLSHLDPPLHLVAQQAERHGVGQAEGKHAQVKARIDKLEVDAGVGVRSGDGRLGDPKDVQPQNPPVPAARDEARDGPPGGGGQRLDLEGAEPFGVCVCVSVCLLGSLG